MILDTLRSDILQARKFRDAKRLTLLTTLLGECDTQAKKGDGKLTDELVLATVKKFIKGIDDLLTLRPDDADAKWEREQLTAYQPRQLDSDALSKLIDEVMAAEPPKRSMGDIMKELKTLAGGQYDGAMASKLVKEKLA